MPYTGSDARFVLSSFRKQKRSAAVLVFVPGEFELQGKHFYTYLEAEGQTVDLILKAIEINEIQSEKTAKALLDTFSAAVIGAIVLWKLEKGGFDIVQKIDTIFDITYR